MLSPQSLTKGSVRPATGTRAASRIDYGPPYRGLVGPFRATKPAEPSQAVEGCEHDPRGEPESTSELFRLGHVTASETFEQALRSTSVIASPSEHSAHDRRLLRQQATEIDRLQDAVYRKDCEIAEATVAIDRQKTQIMHLQWLLQERSTNDTDLASKLETKIAEHEKTKLKIKEKDDLFHELDDLCWPVLVHAGVGRRTRLSIKARYNVTEEV